MTGSPAQRELPQKESPPSLLLQEAPRSGRSLRVSLLLPSIWQPRAAGAPPERASFLHLTGSPAQRELPKNEPPPSLLREAPRSGSSPRKGLLPPSTEQPRAVGAPPERASSFPFTGSPRSGRSLRVSLLLPSIGQPRAAGDPPERASFLHLTGSPAQRELLKNEPTLSLLREAPRSGSSPRKGLLPPSTEQLRAAGAPPERVSSFPIYRKPRAAGDP